MRRIWLLFGVLMFAFAAQATVYHLEKVNSIVGGEKFVLVHNVYNCAMKATAGTAGQNPDFSYKAKNLDGLEEHVWTISKTEGQGTYKIFCCASTQLSIKNNNLIVLDDVSVAGCRWQFNFQESDSTTTIYTTENNGKYIYYNTSTSKYNVGQTAERFSIYRLVPDSYEREVTAGQLGTVCLPYAVDKVMGAEVYQISYLEKEGQGSPKNLYYEIVETELEAGRPYLFVPTDTKVVFQKKCTTMVENPIYCEDGFYGTFAPIQDGVAGTSGNKLEGKYMVKNNTFQKCGGGCSLKANRAYIDMEKVSTSKPQSGAQKRMLVLSKDGVEYITGIKDVRNEKAERGKRMVDGQLVIIKNGVRYNVLGGRL